MKKVLLVIAVLLVGYSSAFGADPYLFTNPSEGVIGYTLTGLTEQTIAAQPDGSLAYNLKSIPIGSTEIGIAACNVWGDCSASVPFVLRRVVPPPPAGVRLGVR